MGVLGAGTGASGPAPKWKPVLKIFTYARRPNAQIQDRLGSGSLCCRSIARRCWNVVWGLGAPCRNVLA